MNETLYFQWLLMILAFFQLSALKLVHEVGDILIFTSDSVLFVKFAHLEFDNISCELPTTLREATGCVFRGKGNMTPYIQKRG